jgi:hypothetical protein
MGMNTTPNTVEKKYEIAIYGQHTLQAGRECLDPESKFGEEWRECADIEVYTGTKAELLRVADSLSSTRQPHLGRIASTITKYLALV